MLLSSILLGIITTFLPSSVSMGVSTVNFFASMEDPTLNWGVGETANKDGKYAIHNVARPLIRDSVKGDYHCNLLNRI